MNSAARTIWTGLEAARANGFDAGKYGLLPLTLEEQGQVIELITQWTSDWTAIPAFYVDTPLVTATEVIDVGQCEVAARRWLKVARGAGATTVLFDAPDRVNPRKLVHGSDSPDGVLTPDQIEALRDYSEVLGVGTSWSGGITAPQAFDLAQRRVFGFSVHRAPPRKWLSQPSFNRIRGWQPKTSRPSSECDACTRSFRVDSCPAECASRTRALPANWKRSPRTWLRAEARPQSLKPRWRLWNQSLVRGWRHLIGAVEDTKSEVANSNRRAPRPVPADFGPGLSRSQEGRCPAANIYRTPRTAFHAVYSPDATPIWIDGVPSRRAARIKGKHDPRRSCPGLLTARRIATTKRKERSAAEHIANYTSWFSICRPAEAGSLNCSRQTRSRPTSPITSSSAP